MWKGHLLAIVDCKSNFLILISQKKSPKKRRKGFPRPLRPVFWINKKSKGLVLKWEHHPHKSGRIHLLDTCKDTHFSFRIPKK